MLTFVKWIDAASEYRWTLWANNNKKIACSGEGYQNKSDLDHAIRLIQTDVSFARIQDNTKKSDTNTIEKYLV